MAKRGIRARLLTTYALLLLVSFIISYFSFNLLLNRYLLNETRQEQIRDGQALAELLGKTSLSEARVRELLGTRPALRLAGKYINSWVVVFNWEQQVIFTNINNISGELLVQWGRRNPPVRDYITTKVAVYDPRGEETGSILLLAKRKEITLLHRYLLRTQLLSFSIAGLAALLLVVHFEKSLTGPLNRLMAKMRRFSLAEHSGEQDIQTGDEIEELASCFNELAGKLKKYDQYQKRFIQDASHELKTPLMSIQGYAEAIKDGVVEGKETKESLDIIITESQRLKKIVEEMLFLSKVENAEEALRLEEGSIKQVVREAVESVEPLAEARGIELNLAGLQDYQVLIDIAKLKQALINVFSNCIRYAGSTVMVDAGAAEGRIRIIIRDDGPGFKTGEETRVFDRFYKDPQHGGTGIGLSIARAIIERHKGAIYASNREPHGAEFVILLPKS